MQSSFEGFLCPASVETIGNASIGVIEGMETGVI